LIVLDASVLTDFLLSRAPTLAALEREMDGHEHQPFTAPS
jgi:hypothetical protein